ncbi:hypothetical protein BYT27DRAFT_7326441, partial [Phlegmacium glaucopus]
SFDIPPPTPSTPSISVVNRLDAASRTFVPRAAAKAVTVKKADGTEVSLENLTKSTPTPSTPAVSSPQSSALRQGSPGTPNQRPASVHIETEDQHKSRLAEQEKEARLKTEAAEKERKEKAEAERKVKEANEICRLDSVREGRGGAKGATSERGGGKEEEQRLKLKQEAEHILKAKEEEEKALRLAEAKAKEEQGRKEKEEREEQE